MLKTIKGSLDAVNGYFVVIGGIGTSGTMQQLLNQVLPLVLYFYHYYIIILHTIAFVSMIHLIVGYYSCHHDWLVHIFEREVFVSYHIYDLH